MNKEWLKQAKPVSNHYRELYNHLAEGYDLRQHNPATSLLRRREVKLIKKFASGKVLDLGCGTGYHLDFIEDVTGLDISEKVLKFAKPKNKSLIHGDIENLPLKAASFDSILCFYSTLNLVDLYKAVSEMSRVLKLSGKVLLSVASIGDIDKYRSSHETKIKKFRLEGKPVNMRLFEKEELVEAFEKNGFELKRFDSIFRIQKPRWGNFQKFSFLERFKLKIENLFPKKWGKIYFFVFEKS